jgi:WD40 repeat protein
MVTSSVVGTLAFWGATQEEGEDDGPCVKLHSGARVHTEAVTCLCFSHDGELLAAGAADGRVLLWAGAGKLPRGLRVPARDFHAPGGAVTGVAFSPDCRNLAASTASRVVVWDICGVTLNRASVNIGDDFWLAMNGHVEAVTSTALSHDGSRLATSSMDKTVRVWEVATGALVRTLHHPVAVQRVWFDEDTERLRVTVSGAGARQLVWRLNDGTLLEDGRKVASEAAEEVDAEEVERTEEEEDVEELLRTEPFGFVVWQEYRISTSGGSIPTRMWLMPHPPEA